MLTFLGSGHELCVCDRNVRMAINGDGVGVGDDVGRTLKTGINCSISFHIEWPWINSWSRFTYSFNTRELCFVLKCMV